MLFTSPEFLFGFLPAILGGSILIGCFRSEKLSLLFLVSGSLFFYGWWNLKLLPLLLFSVVMNFAIGHYLLEKKSKAIFVFGILLNLALIAIFKYLDFSIESINFLFTTEFSLPNITLPLAISFFTFQQIAYLSDTYIGKTSDPSFLKYVLFVTFFPQLIAGPIVHHGEMIPQFSKARLFRLNARDVGIGFEIFAIGLFKKLIIADGIAPYSDDIFGAVASGVAPSFFDAWGGALAYTIQIYFDFSGYSDMAIGLAWMFGIKLPLNFASPYKATSIIDFWRRWHMTLSRFLKDYLYIPLGGNRMGIPRRYLNILITMLLGGLWHGAAWTFVAWGLLHGGYIIINQLWRYCVHRFGWQVVCSSPLYKLSSGLLTFWCVVIGWIFFRAESFESGLRMLRGTFGLNGFYLPNFMRFGFLTDHDNAGSHILVHGDVYQWIFLFLGIMLIAPNTQQILRPWFQPVAGASGSTPDRYDASLRQLFLIPFCLSTLVVGSLVIIARGKDLGNFIYMVF